MTTLGRYELHEELGRGGFGTVYRAVDTTLGREVALKVLHPQLTVDPDFLEKFRNEARTVAGLKSPNIVTIYELGEIDGRVFIAMDYMVGGSLKDKLAKEGKLSFEETLRILKQVCTGLDKAHQKGLVHRDIKPANILFDEDSNAVISDFGLAKAVQNSSMTASSNTGGVGTPAYRAPELWEMGKVITPVTDIYSLGCVFSEMLTGKVLFDADTTERILTQHLITGPQIPERFPGDIPEYVTKILKQMLVKEPAERYKDTRALIDALDKAVKEGTKSPAPEKTITKLPIEKPEKEETTKPQKDRKTEKPVNLDKPWMFWAMGITALILLIWFFRSRLPVPAPTTKAAIQISERTTSVTEITLNPTPSITTFTPKSEETLIEGSDNFLNNQKGKIVYSADCGNQDEIYVFDMASGGKTRLTNNDIQDRYPVWSPDGKSIAFSQARFAENGYKNVFSNISIIDADGQNYREIINLIATDISNFDWSPDGKKIIFAADIHDEYDTDIFSIDVQTGELVQILEDGISFDAQPSYSPWGDEILYMGLNEDGTVQGIYLTDINGKNITKVISCYEIAPPAMILNSPEWSPLGTDFIITADYGGPGEIFNINLENKKFIQLTNFGDKGCFDHDARWSPDGKSIFFTDCSLNGGGISRINFDGSGYETLIQDNCYNHSPDYFN